MNTRYTILKTLRMGALTVATLATASSVRAAANDSQSEPSGAAQVNPTTCSLPGSACAEDDPKAPTQFGQIDEFTYQLRKEDLVRWDNPVIKVPLHLEWIKDWPKPIDKREFRKIQPSPDHQPGVVSVAFKPGTSQEKMDAAHARIGTKIAWESQLVPLTYDVEFEGREVVDVMNAYLDLDEVLYAQPSYIYHPEATPNDPFYRVHADGAYNLWGLAHVEPGASHASEAWDEWTGDPNFIIAVIDTGVQHDHPDLIGNRWVNTGEIPGNNIDDDHNGYVDDVYGWNVGDALALPGTSPQRWTNGSNVLPCMPEHIHGTHVAGTLGAVGNNQLGVAGMNWRCKIMTLRCVSSGFMSCCANGLSTCEQISYGYRALEYAVRNGARVSNNSWGTFRTDGLESPEDATMRMQINNAQAAGHIFVASAGNDSDNLDLPGHNHFPSGYGLANIISVGNIQPDGFGSPDTNYSYNEVNILAPGADVYSTIPGPSYGFLSGTSMASPHVAGAIALVWSRYPDLNWQHLVLRMLDAGRNNEHVPCTTHAQLYVPAALGVSTTPFLGLAYGFAFSPIYGTINLSPGTYEIDPGFGGPTAVFPEPRDSRAPNGGAILTLAP